MPNRPYLIQRYAKVRAETNENGLFTLHLLSSYTSKREYSTIWDTGSIPQLFLPDNL